MSQQRRASRAAAGGPLSPSTYPDDPPSPASTPFQTRPDPMRFQHHLDHNSKILAHGAHLLTPRTSVLAMRNSQPQPVVRDMWDWWPQAQVNQSRVRG